jgi:Protein of unknown function (DUF3616)
MVNGSLMQDLFEPGNVPSQASPIVTPVALGKLGIRDLALLPDKRLLILAGAKEPKEEPSRIVIFNPADGTQDQRGALPVVTAKVKGKDETGKAEGITVLEIDANNIRAFVLFDDLPDGAAQLAVIPLK